MEPMNLTLASEDCNLYTYDMRRLQAALCVHKVCPSAHPVLSPRVAASVCSSCKASLGECMHLSEHPACLFAFTMVERRYVPSATICSQNQGAGVSRDVISCCHLCDVLSMRRCIGLLTLTDRTLPAGFYVGRHGRGLLADRARVCGRQLRPQPAHLCAHRRPQPRGARRQASGILGRTFTLGSILNPVLPPSSAPYECNWSRALRDICA